MSPLVRLGAVVLLALLLAACGGDEIAITPRAIPSATPTEEPLPTRTPRPQPTASHTPAPTALYVANTQGQGAVLRGAPGTGERIAGLAEGSRVAPQGDEQVLDGRKWLRVQDATGRAGWIAAELLVATPPATPARPAPTATPRR
ncbi:MAG TPA: hypothetical protein VGL23_24625 [Chloroflexota bacterium]